MAAWTNRRGALGRWPQGVRVEQAPPKPQGADAAIVVISSDPRFARPNFDKCRRDSFCRCRACKPSQAANG